MTKIGELIKQKRESRGYGLRQFALKAGISASTLSKIENGERPQPEPETIEKIASGFNEIPTDFYAAAGYSDSFIRQREAYHNLPSSEKEAIDNSLPPLLAKMFKNKRLRSTPQIVLFTGGALTGDEVEELRKGVSPALFPEEKLIKFFRRFDIEDIHAYYEAAHLPVPQEFQDVEAEFRKALRKVRLSADRSPETMEYVIQMVREEFDDLED